MTSGPQADRGGFWPWELDPDYQPHQRASALYGAHTCNAYMFLGQTQKLKRRDNSTVYTGVGTIGHKWLELQIQMGPEAADDYLKKHLDQVPDDFPLALDELWEWLGESGLLIRGAEYLTEQKVELQAGTCLITGHIDLIQVFRSLGVVIDWKFYNNLSMLPPIEEDLQMVAYGVGAHILCPELEHIEVHRVACYHLKSHKLEFDKEALVLARRAIEEEAEKIWLGRTTFTPGAQCLSCLLRNACPAFRKQAIYLETAEIAPYKSGEIESAEQAIKFLLAAKAIEARIEEGKNACQAWVKKHGKLEDASIGQLWGPWTTQKDTILDVAAVLGQLGETVGSLDLAIQAAKTSKSEMEAVMKQEKIKPKERTAFFKGLRDKGLMIKKEGNPRWEWKKPKPKSDRQPAC